MESVYNLHTIRKGVIQWYSKMKSTFQVLQQNLISWVRKISIDGEIPIQHQARILLWPHTYQWILNIKRFNMHIGVKVFWLRIPTYHKFSLNCISRNVNQGQNDNPDCMGTVLLSSFLILIRNLGALPSMSWILLAWLRSKF